MTRQYHIGTLVKSSETRATEVADDPSAPFLDPKVWKSAKLTSVKRVNHDSFIFYFALSDPQRMLGLAIGQHVFLRLKDPLTGEMIQRAYTPISKNTALGSIELLVK
jgi:nitrate reductase (NAD(P)H)